MRLSTLWAAPSGSQRPNVENRQNEIMDMKYFVSCKSVYTSRVIVANGIRYLFLFTSSLLAWENEFLFSDCE